MDGDFDMGLIGRSTTYRTSSDQFTIAAALNANKGTKLCTLKMLKDRCGSSEENVKIDWQSMPV